MSNAATSNRDVVERFIREGMNPETGEWNLEVIGETFDFDRYFSHSWGAGLVETGQKMAAYFAAFEWIETFDEAIVADGDLVVYRATDRVKHVGEVLGVAPTNRVLTVHRVEMWRVDNGRIVEHWGGAGDIWNLYQQITTEV